MPTADPSNDWSRLDRYIAERRYMINLYSDNHGDDGLYCAECDARHDELNQLDTFLRSL
jgi:hypothetical protein